MRPPECNCGPTTEPQALAGAAKATQFVSVLTCGLLDLLLLSAVSPDEHQKETFSHSHGANSELVLRPLQHLQHVDVRGEFAHVMNASRSWLSVRSQPLQD